MEPLYPSIISLCAASVPFLAPPNEDQDASTLYSKNYFTTSISQNNHHRLAAVLLALSAFSYGIALVSPGGAISDILFLIGLSCLAGYLYGCAKSTMPASDATWWWLVLLGITQLASSTPIQGWRGCGIVSCVLTAVWGSVPVGYHWLKLGPARQTTQPSNSPLAASLENPSTPAAAVGGSGPTTPSPSPPTVNPGDVAPFLDRITWRWMTPFMALGASRPLEASDLPPPPYELLAAQISRAMDKASALPTPPPTFLALLFTLWWPLLRATAGFKLAFDTLQCAGPLLLASLITWLEAMVASSSQTPQDPSLPPAAPAPTLASGLWIVGLILLTSVAQTLLLHQYFTRSFKLGMLLKATTILAVVKKTLLLSIHSNSSNGGSSSGSGGSGVSSTAEGGAGKGKERAPPSAASSASASISVVASDAKRLQDVATYLCSIVSAPYQIIIYTTLLWLQLGPSVLAGVAVMLCAMPLNAALARWGEKLQVAMMAARDARVSATSEALGGIRLIKWNAWEGWFEGRIGGLRGVELGHLWWYKLCENVGEVTWLGVPVCVALASFGAFASSGGHLSPRVVFTSLSLFNLLRFPLTMLPSLVASLTEARVSVGRIQAFLDAPEVQRGCITYLPREGERREGGAGVGMGVGAGRGQEVALTITDEQQPQQQQQPLPPTAAVVFNNAVLTFSASTPPPSSHTSASASSSSGGRETFILGPLNLNLPRNALVAIVGASGSGKSALLQAALGEMHRWEGSITLPQGALCAYAPQTPFIRNATLRENITFSLGEGGGRGGGVEGGHHTHSHAVATSTLDNGTVVAAGEGEEAAAAAAIFQAAIEGACLGPDIAALPGNVESEIGEKGINLSGGQKARVQLARAFYAARIGSRGGRAAAGAFPPNREVILCLDDPLSAVDAHVGAALLETLAAGALAGTCTRLLVTHAMHVLPVCDYVVVMDGGRVAQVGTPKEVCSSPSPPLLRLLKAARDGAACVAGAGKGGEVLAAATAASATAAAPEDVGAVAPPVEDATHPSTSAPLLLSASPPPLPPSPPLKPAPSPTIPPSLLAAAGAATAKTSAIATTTTTITITTTTTPVATGQQTTTESRERGAVSRATVMAYIHAAGGGGALGIILASYCAFYACNLGGQFWLATWSSAGSSSGSSSSIPVSTGLGVYAALSLGSLLVLGAQCMAVVAFSVGAATELHRGLLATLLRLPASFYDTTPVGRLLNRVSADMASLDGPLPESLNSFLSTAFNVGASLLTAAAATPVFAVGLLPTLYAFRALQQYYVATSRELQRLDSTSRSPLFSHLAETAGGLAVVRAYGLTLASRARASHLLDGNNRAYHSGVSANRWLAVRVEVLSALLTTGCAAAAVVSAGGWLGGGGVSKSFPSAAGLAVSTVLGISQSLNWCVRKLSDAESQLVAVERVKEYADLPPEKGNEGVSAGASPSASASANSSAPSPPPPSPRGGPARGA